MAFRFTSNGYDLTWVERSDAPDIQREVVAVGSDPTAMTSMRWEVRAELLRRRSWRSDMNPTATTSTRWKGGLMGLGLTSFGKVARPKEQCMFLNFNFNS